ncbi:MAG TPA: hypothetical protein VF453_08355 [Burkholderiaceae bacterium]
MADSNSKSSHEPANKVDDAFAEDLLEKVHSCAPILAEADVELIEHRMQSADFGIGRRIGLVTASKDGAWFKSVSTGTDHALAVGAMSAMHGIREHIERMRELTNWLESAEIRLMVALAAREDYQELEAEVLNG